ncbi:MAG: hypothetical protein SGJ27_30770 [Candidatus Melainabacteria bacterium]|nr:hypothetical protein [Candidatus Melainabacteria bacterium]
MIVDVANDDYGVRIRRASVGGAVGIREAAGDSVLLAGLPACGSRDSEVKRNALPTCRQSWDEMRAIANERR